MDLKPHHIGIVVSDLERSTAFYRALGFEAATELPTDAERAIRFMRLGDFEIELFWYAAPAAEAHAPAGKGQLGYRHLAFRTDDIDGVLAELKAADMVPADLTVRDVPIGYRLVLFRDPDGLEIEIMQED